MKRNLLATFFDPTNIFDWFMNPISFEDNEEIFTHKYPKINRKETNEAYVVEFALPGVSKDDIKITIENDAVHVKYASTSENNEKDDEGNYTSHQWSSQEFEETFDIPANGDDENISAEFKDGVLTLSIPKNADESIEGNAKTIEIQ